MDIIDNYLTLKTLGALAREIRKKAGLSQVAVARRIGSSQPNVSAAENGKDTRTVNVAIKIIEMIGLRKVDGPFYAIEKQERDHD